MKEIMEDTKKWKRVPCSGTGRKNAIKTSLLSKAIYIFIEVPIEVVSAHFTEL